MRRLSLAMTCLLAGVSAASAAPTDREAPETVAPGPAAPENVPSMRGTPDRAATADRLLGALKQAQTEQDAAIIEAHLLRIWINAASPAARLLVNRGIRELAAGAHEEAVTDFDALVALEPTLPEAWHQRALARFAAGDSAGAVSDLGRVIQLEPRHFPAWALLAQIAEARGDWKAAFDAWTHVMELDPKAPGGDDRLKDLRRRAFGQDT